MRRMLALVVVCGVSLTLLAARHTHASVRDAATLAAIAVVAAVVAGLAGFAALALLRRRSVAVQAGVVALTSVLAVGAGALAAADTMFLSQHDLDALLVVLAAAGTVGLITALVLGGRITAGSRRLVDLARRIGDGEGADLGSTATAGPVPPAELADLATELRVMSSRLDEARHHERALEASRRELVAWVSHDLRTPLAGVRAMAEALEDGIVDDVDTTARYHRTMRQEVERLAGLVDDLFELSRIESGTLDLRLERASLSDVVSDAVAGASVVADAKGVLLEGSLQGAVPELDLATSEVSRVLRNLLDNAIRHTPPSGRVRVEAGVEDAHAVVSVHDACGGIPDDELDRVFDLAFRGDAARSPGGDGGAGLGLAIARGIVEAHHGDIGVCNEGGGCRFTLRLPL